MLVRSDQSQPATNRASPLIPVQNGRPVIGISKVWYQVVKKPAAPTMARATPTAATSTWPNPAHRPAMIDPRPGQTAKLIAR